MAGGIRHYVHNAKYSQHELVDRVYRRHLRVASTGSGCNIAQTPRCGSDGINFSQFQTVELVTLLSV